MASSRREEAEKFVERWRGHGDEQQEGRTYWIDLMQNVLGLEDALRRLRFEVPTPTDSGSAHDGLVDVLIPSAKTLVEQKSFGIDLDRPETRQGRLVTPVEQALGYSRGTRWEDKPRYLVTCNFSTIRVYDLNADPLCKADPFELALEDVPKNLSALDFLKGGHEAPSSLTQAVSIKAGEVMGRIHDLVAARFVDPDSPESHHALSVFCTRVMFLMYCEDANLIDAACFHDYMQRYRADDLRRALLDLFEWLDTPDDERDPYASDALKAFPYMNGGMFRERTQVPQLDETIRTELIVSGSQDFDWSGIDPTVFGSIFEGALSHDARRAGGMHYTSPENIHKVIDPLFLDDLRDELSGILAMDNGGGARTKALMAFQDKLGGLTFLDPACGSGNFLTETYVCLRRLENRVLTELHGDSQAVFIFEDVEDSPVKVSLSNFHGIEINDFACCVARTALWIAEKQADADTSKVCMRIYDELPLTDYAGIVEGNALRMDWNDVVPADECDYVMGNPPFIGKKEQTSAQKTDIAALFVGNKSGNLDYVCGWFKKASIYCRSNHMRCAFVATNSIAQGEQPSLLWPSLYESGIEISFAYIPFVWSNQADDQAHVHVVIIGFNLKNSAPKFIFNNSNESRNVVEINPYLSDGPQVVVASRKKPISDVPEMEYGSMPIDSGFLTDISEDEIKAIQAESPDCIHCIRTYVGGKELLHGVSRKCIWIDEKDLTVVGHSTVLRERIKKCRDYRLSSTRVQTVKAADMPWRFGEVRQPDSDMVVIPKVSSQRRRYIPICFINPKIIVSGSALLVPRASLYLFGVLSSQFHNAWMRKVAGRMKSDYQYSANIVYNNYVWPDSTDVQHSLIERYAQAVLDARGRYSDDTLSDMYNPDNDFLFPDLMRAHKLLDRAVEEAYGVDFDGDEEKIVAHLFKLYAEKTKGE